MSTEQPDQPIETALPPAAEPAAADGEIPAEERTLAALTHLSGLAGYVIPLGGVIVPIVIWIVKSDSRLISSIAKQALLLNVMIFVLGSISVVLILTVILIPLLIPLWIMLALAALVLPIIGALRANEGIYYRYPVVGAMIS